MANAAMWRLESFKGYEMHLYMISSNSPQDLVELTGLFGFLALGDGLQPEIDGVRAQGVTPCKIWKLLNTCVRKDEKNRSIAL